MFKSYGKLTYDPTIQLNVKTTPEPWWVILDCDEEIARYYRWLIKRSLWKDTLLRPAWGAHISIVRGELPLHPEHWKKDGGKSLTFEYSGELRSNGKHFWLDVESEQIADVRDRLGLGRKPRFSNFHLTVGSLDLPPRSAEKPSDKTDQKGSLPASSSPKESALDDCA